MTRDDLIAFEAKVAEKFNAGKIPYPIHLDSGNEDALIEIFEGVKPQDWIFTSWRGHYKALLKGVPWHDLMAAIMRGESMALRFDEYRVYGSAIVGGTIPNALGVAMGIKRHGAGEHVWCFLGDMTSETGVFLEASKYAGNHDLPITWVIEDNGVSVCTETAAVWGEPAQPDIRCFEYRSGYPHAGAGQRVRF